MIHLQTLGGRAIALNCDQIAWMEACPDTTIHLLSGQSLIVREPVDEVVRRVAAYRSAVLRGAGRDGTAALDALPALLASAAVGAAVASGRGGAATEDERS